jgi:hypothetical protein
VEDEAHMSMWEPLESFVHHAPLRTTVVIAGDFNASLGAISDASCVGRAGGEPENFNGQTLRQFSLQHGFFLPISFMKGRKSGWTWQSTQDPSLRRRIDHWLLPLSCRHRVSHQLTGVIVPNPIHPAGKKLDHRLIGLQVVLPWVPMHQRPLTPSQPTFKPLQRALLKERGLEERPVTTMLQHGVALGLEGLPPWAEWEKVEAVLHKAALQTQANLKQLP